MEPDYDERDTHDFGAALDFLKEGKKVCRSGWNGKDVWLYLVIPDAWGMTSEVPFDYRNLAKRLLPWIGMKTADDGFVPWLASQTDLLSNDWKIVP